MPNKELNLFIQLAVQNNGQISKKKRKRFEEWINKESLVELEKLIFEALEKIKLTRNS